MATDFLFYYMTQPLGLVAIGVAVLLPFLLWRIILAASFDRIGFWPLALAYACAFVCLLALGFVTSYTEFSTRVVAGQLSEAQRWSIVPGWTIYTSVLSLVFALPALGLIAVPIAAGLLKKHKLTLLYILASSTIVWLALSLAAWSFPMNIWHARHRLDSLVVILQALLPGVTIVGMPFLAAVAASARCAQHAHA